MRVLRFSGVVPLVVSTALLFGVSSAQAQDACELAFGLPCSEFEEAYVKASNTDARDTFGFSVDLDGDTLVVGALFEDSNATGVNGNEADNSATLAGAVYVFTRSGGVWSQQAYIKASNTGRGDQFGLAVALDGDTLVVGAHQEDSDATEINGNQSDDSAIRAGAAYVRRIAPPATGVPAQPPWAVLLLGALLLTALGGAQALKRSWSRPL